MIFHWYLIKKNLLLIMYRFTKKKEFSIDELRNIITPKITNNEINRYSGNYTKKNQQTSKIKIIFSKKNRFHT